MAKIATKRVSNYVDHDEKMYIEIPYTGVTIYADKIDGYGVDEINTKTGEMEGYWQPDYYTLSSQQEMMPTYHTDKFSTIEDICKAMKEYADLRKWRVIPEETYS